MAGEHINDLWRDWLLVAIPQTLLELNNELLSIETALDAGLLWNWSHHFSINGAGTENVKFTTREFKSLIFAMSITLTGSERITVSGFAASTNSGGASVDFVFPNNHNNPADSPWVGDSVTTGGTATGGVQFLGAEFNQGSKEATATGEAAAYILNPDTAYRFEIENFADPAEITMTMLAASVI